MHRVTFDGLIEAYQYEFGGDGSLDRLDELELSDRVREWADNLMCDGILIPHGDDYMWID